MKKKQKKDHYKWSNFKRKKSFHGQKYINYKKNIHLEPSIEFRYAVSSN